MDLVLVQKLYAVRSASDLVVVIQDFPYSWLVCRRLRSVTSEDITFVYRLVPVLRDLYALQRHVLDVRIASTLQTQFFTKKSIVQFGIVVESSRDSRNALETHKLLSPQMPQHVRSTSPCRVQKSTLCNLIEIRRTLSVPDRIKLHVLLYSIGNSTFAGRR